MNKEIRTSFQSFENALVENIDSKAQVIDSKAQVKVFETGEEIGSRISLRLL